MGVCTDETYRYTCPRNKGEVKEGGGNQTKTPPLGLPKLLEKGGANLQRVYRDVLKNRSWENALARKEGAREEYRKRQGGRKGTPPRRQNQDDQEEEEKTGLNAKWGPHGPPPHLHKESHQLRE